MTFDSEKIKKYCMKAAYCAGKYYWLLAIVLLLAVFLIVGVVFFQYTYPIFTGRQGISAESIKINQTVFGQIKNHLENSRQNLQNVLNGNYQDPFR